MDVVGRIPDPLLETPEGEKRSVTEVEADEIGPSLKFATAKVERPQPGRLGRRRLGGQRGRGQQGYCPTTSRYLEQEHPEKAAPRTCPAPSSASQPQVLPVLRGEAGLHRLQGRQPARQVHERLGARSAPAGSPGNCAQHQRDVAAAVKNAREMALLPYSIR